MSETIDAAVAAILEAFGGKEAFRRTSEQQLRHFDRLWSQNTALVGRVLRAHLVVEHYLTRYLEALMNPRLPPLESVRLSFEEKVRLVPSDDTTITMLKPGMRRLNRIRNRVAHNLEAHVTTEDRSAFLGMASFAALRQVLNEDISSADDSPIAVLEDFAKLAGSWLQSSADGSAEKWRQALARFGEADKMIP